MNLNKGLVLELAPLVKVPAAKPGNLVGSLGHGRRKELISASCPLTFIQGLWHDTKLNKNVIKVKKNFFETGFLCYFYSYSGTHFTGQAVLKLGGVPVSAS